MKYTFQFIVVLVFLTNAFASEFKEKKPSREIVKASKSINLSIEDVHHHFIENNIDIAVAYEKLYQAQSKIAHARSRYFPYGLGDSLLIYFNNPFSGLILLELATSIPSKWLNVQAEKYLAQGVFYNLMALKENIKNIITNHFLTILKEEKLVSLHEQELELLKKQKIIIEHYIDIGISKKENLEEIKNKIFELNDEILKLEGYLFEEKAVFKELLNLPQSETIYLRPIADNLFLRDFDYIRDIKLVLERSYELKAASEFINASYKIKKATRFSLFSFQGIGFNYLAKIALAQAKINDAYIRRDLTILNLKKSFFLENNLFQNNLTYFKNEKILFKISDEYLTKLFEEYEQGSLSLYHLINAQIEHIHDNRRFILAKYAMSINYANLKRILQEPLKM